MAPSKPQKKSLKQKKVAEVMHKFKEGDLHAGKTEGYYPRCREGS